MATLSAHARIELEGARAVIDEVCEHLRSHGVDVEDASDRRVLTFDWGRCVILVDGGYATLDVEASSLTGIAVVREALTRELIEHAPELADKIAWRGAGDDLKQPAWFCLLTVAETWRRTPHMQRIRFKGHDLTRYAGSENIHMRLMFPCGGNIPAQWPTISPNGVTNYPPDHVLAIRKYTYRHIDPVADTLDVDFVLHEDAGPGSDFAARAKPGDVVGMGGPGGRSAPRDRDWYLLAGDETALPAISRILENLPPTARGVALIEIADAHEEQPIDVRGDFQIRWLHRNGTPAGTTDLLPDAVRTVEFPSDGSSLFVWAGCESAAFKAIRSYMRGDRGLKKDESLIVSYWRRGGTQGEQEKDDH